MRKIIPKFVLDNMGLRTSREFKQLKRQELARIISALEEYNVGSSCCPDELDTLTLLENLRAQRNKQSQQCWGK